MVSIYVAMWIPMAILVPMPYKLIAVGCLFLLAVAGIFIHKHVSTQIPRGKVEPAAH